MEPVDHTLATVQIILLAPRSSGNAGATARAIANHGLGRLVLVAPPHFGPDRARWMAPRAHARFDGAPFVGTVQEAIEPLDVERVIGTTSRKRRLVTPVWGPQERAEVIHPSPRSSAIVFDPEDLGLDHGSVARCDAPSHHNTQLPEPGPSRTHHDSQLAPARTELSREHTCAPRAPPLRAQVTDDLIEVLHETPTFQASPSLPSRHASHRP
jgi:tRNA/rRNA methyltransferase